VSPLSLSSRFWFKVAAAVVACALIYVGEHALESLLESEEGDPSSIARSVFQLRRVYQATLTAGWLKPGRSFTAVVELNPRRDERLRSLTLNMVCEQRGFLAKLIGRIADEQPEVIVLDKYFGPASCPRDPADTIALREAIDLATQAAPHPVRVVVGLSVSRRSGEPQPNPSLFDDAAVDQGIVNIHHDVRRMALRWCGRVDPVEGLTRPAGCETLALRAARAYRPTIVRENQRGLRDLLVAGRHPYISFIPPEDFCQFDVLGDATLRVNNEDVCKRTSDGPRTGLGYLRGRIVLVGERSSTDMHDTVVGPVSGVFVQANYIEALLDRRYFRPVPWLDYALGVVLFAVVTLLPLAWSTHPWVALLAVAGAVVVTMGLVLALLLLYGLYVNPVGVGVLALLIDGSHTVLSRIVRRDHP